MDMLYNLDELWDLTDGDKELIISMVDQFIVDVNISLDNIKNALISRDFLSLKFAAHRIKPAINNFQIFSLKTVIEDIEVKAEQQLYDVDLQISCSELIRIMTNVIEQLQQEFEL